MNNIEFICISYVVISFVYLAVKIMISHNRCKKTSKKFLSSMKYGDIIQIEGDNWFNYIEVVSNYTSRNTIAYRVVHHLSLTTSVGDIFLAKYSDPIFHLHYKNMIDKNNQ